MLSNPSFAQEEIDCSHAIGMPQITICAATRLDAAEARLEKVYQQALARGLKIKDSYADEPLFETTDIVHHLKLGQEHWLQSRDHTCKAHGGPYDGGTGQPLMIISCKEDMTVQRAQYFKKILMMHLP